MKKERADKKNFYTHYHKFIFWLVVLLSLVFLWFLFFKWLKHYPASQDLTHRPGFFGVTFSKKFCGEIGLDWREVYLATLDDLQVKDIRLPVYWDDIEASRGSFDFADYDFMIKEGTKRNVRFILNIGWRLPRWPECHAPGWASVDNLDYTQSRAKIMLEQVVLHYKDEPSIVAWQLENEPFFNEFGVCPRSDERFFQEELALVRGLDSRPIVVSAPGELSWWRKEAKYGDIFGSTLYRVVWGPQTGYVRYPIPSWFYRLKAYLAGIKPENRLIIELQAEPWVPKGSIVYLSEADAAKSFNIRQFRANLRYAINVNFSKAYLWGVEWWYWQYKHDNQNYWKLAKEIFY